MNSWLHISMDIHVDGLFGHAIKLSIQCENEPIFCELFPMLIIYQCEIQNQYYGVCE
jgi:hypothetical protein